MINLSISGACGRMGQRIIHFALADKDVKITSLLECPGHPKAGEKVSGISVSTSPDALQGSGCLIEFTSPEATMTNLKACVAHKVKMVIGTTGISPGQAQEIEKASKVIPIVFSSNMSVGVNVFFKVTELLAKTLPASYVVNITEAHHVHKKDAPSGTAKTLASIIEKASGRKVADIKSIREGEIVGDHKIVFESGEDVITIDHHAKSRDIFARGALVAAKFLAGKQTGLFTMQQVLGLGN